VDEVLAVGDVAFQKKCLQKMGEAGMKGRTVLFVSHNMSAISNLCERVILLEGGRLKKDGPPLEIIAHYLSSDTESEEVLMHDDQNRGFRLMRPPAELSFPCGENISFQFEILCPEPFSDASSAVILTDVFENPVVGASSRLQGLHGDGVSTRWIIECDMGNIPLNYGLYNVTVKFGNENRNYAVFTRAFTLNVLPSKLGRIPKNWGSFYWKPKWQIHALMEDRETTVKVLSPES
ncbi:hypothetical protein L0244_24820, partial [bacterium]|nr:hypothetical protein [bacterium]